MTWGKLGDLDLSEVGKVYLESEGGSAFDDATYRVASMDGRGVDPFATRQPMDLDLRIIFDTDGEGGGYDPMSQVKQVLSSRSLVALTRTTPHAGEVRAMVRQFMPPLKVNHITYRFQLTAPSGSWQDAVESSESASLVETEGDVWVHDPIIVFSGAGTLTHTTSDGVVSQITAEAGPSYPVTVSLHESGRWVAVDDDGNDARGAVWWTRPWVLRMEPGTEQDFSGSATIRWRNRWA